MDKKQKLTEINKLPKSRTDFDALYWASVYWVGVEPDLANI